MGKSSSFYISIALAIILGLVVANYIWGWTTPSANPPNANLPAPLNTGSSNQSKVGYLAVGTSTAPEYPLEVGNQLRVWGQIISKVASGTAPLVVDSPTVVANLNADKLDGYDAADLSAGGDTIWGYSAPPGDCAPYNDCDGDGYTAFTGDCDESCDTCYVGSIAVTAYPDGKDQDCDGIIDEGTGVSYYLYHTSEGYTGQIGGREQADALCFNDPNKPNICGEGWAFMSLGSDDEICDLPTTKGIDTSAKWYFQVGYNTPSLAAYNFNDLLDGSVRSRPESGGFTFNYRTFSDSRGRSDDTCSWGTSSSSSLDGTVGGRSYSDARWLECWHQACSTSYVILCFCVGGGYH